MRYLPIDSDKLEFINFKIFSLRKNLISLFGIIKPPSFSLSVKIPKLNASCSKLFTT